MVTEGEVISVMRYLVAAYPRCEVQETTVVVYVMQFVRARLAADALLLAAMNLIDTSQWMPTVAELVAETQRIEAQRLGWYMSANYLLFGHPLPEELCLPDETVRQVFGYEQLELEAARGD